MSDDKAILLITDSERDSNMYYATSFLAPDPFVYIQKDGGRIIIINDLELDRAKSQSKADKVYFLYLNMKGSLEEKGSSFFRFY